MAPKLSHGTLLDTLREQASAVMANRGVSEAASAVTARVPWQQALDYLPLAADVVRFFTGAFAGAKERTQQAAVAAAGPERTFVSRARPFILAVVLAGAGYALYRAGQAYGEQARRSVTR